MATLVIPSLMLDLTRGNSSLESPSSSVLELIMACELAYPGAYNRMTYQGKLRPGLAVAVDGVVDHRDINAPLGQGSVVRLLPAVKGG